MEVWLVLGDSPQTQWLQFAGAPGRALLGEVEEGLEAVWRWITARRMEAPDKFSAIQTYRAALGLLGHQRAFVEEMAHGELLTGD